MNKSVLLGLSGLCGGLLIGGWVGFGLNSGSHEAAPMALGQSGGSGPCPGGAEPEYWVAPMDANFRRDQPGKSPMGMDLVPFCAQQENSAHVLISPAVEQSLGVRTSTVRRAPMGAQVRAVGTVGWNEDTLLHVHTRAEGWVEELGVGARGETVQPGQTLYALFSPKLYAAEAEYLNAASAGLREAAASRLRALGYQSEQVRALAQRGQAQERMRQTSPGERTVVELGVRSGQFVTPGTMMMVLADPREVWLTVQVAERDAARVQPGQSAQAWVSAWPDRSWEGRVEHVYPELDPITRTLRVRLAFPNPDGALRPNMYAAVLIEESAPQEELLVPAQSVIHSGQGARVVKALGGGQFNVVPVRLGHSQGGQTQVLEGLQAGDAVVTSGQFLLDSEANVDAEALRLASAEPPSGMAEGTVVHVDKANRSLVLQHGPFEPMGPRGMAMDAMTMGFAVAPEVDLQGLSAGETVHVVVQNPSMGVYIVTQLHRMGGGQPAADKGHQGHEMHQGHQMHPGMDHSGHAPAAAEPGQPEHKHGSHDHD